MAEFYGRRIAAMLAADTALKIRTGCTSFLNRHLNQAANTGLVKSCKRVRFVDLGFIVGI